MLTIGVTGGAGAGKSAILDHICEVFGDSCLVIKADDVANTVKLKGEEGYEPVVALLGEGILGPDLEIDRKKMAAALFGSRKLIDRVNGILHPIVNRRILGEIERERQRGVYDIVFIEAALLIENGYDRFTDEMWYIYASEDTRRNRLRSTRGYDDDRIEGIFAAQLKEEENRKAADLVIDNDGDKETAFRQTDEAIRDRIGGLLYAKR